jgi:predicted O-linked N-acetylglucosamine transferase (SPINDLY family)
MGHTQGARPGIFAHRAVPIQASYLGYPGTIGAEFIDYIIADPRVLPIEEQPFYVEKILHLPDTYQITDSERNVSARIPSRSEIGLPERAFVFCCFNSSYKISEPMFEIWMRLLRSIEASVLWLAISNEVARENLRREAERRGIGSERLVLTGRVNHEDYLARQALADLFLDTLPYNAHGTGSNALGAGLPVLTCRGETFPGRVGASMLHAVGLPELVTNNLEEYEALAAKLATDRELLRSVRRKLDANRRTSPLFDTDRFRRHIEAAYLKIWDIYQRGEPPRHVRIEPASADRE